MVSILSLGGAIAESMGCKVHSIHPMLGFVPPMRLLSPP